MTATEISAKFSNMGFLCVCLVVTMHVHCPWEGGGINQLAVPFFFAMSGYFLAAHVDEKGWYGAAVRKRARTLLLPLFAWCGLWLLYAVPIALLLNHHAGRPLFSNLLTGWGILRYAALDLTCTPAMGPLWYVRCLFFFVLVSPLMVALIRRLGVVALIPVCMVYLAYALYVRAYGVVDVFSYGFSLEGLFYFTIGLYLRMRNHLLDVSSPAGAVLFGLGLFVYWLGCVEFAIPLTIVGLWGLMPTRPFPKVLTQNTFPIYLIHMFVLLFFGSTKIANPFVAIGVGCMAIVVSLFVAMVLRKLLPRTASLLFGGR